MREFFDALGDYLESIRGAFLAYVEIVFGIGLRISDEAEDFWNDHRWVRVVVRTVFWGIPLLTIIGLTLLIYGINSLIDGQIASGLSLLLWAMICNAIAGGLLSLVGRTIVFAGLLAWLLSDVLIAAPANAIRDVGRYLVAAGSWVRQNTQGILRYIAAFNPEVTLPELNEAFTEFEAPETLPVFGPAQRRIRRIVRICIRLVWAIERWFIWNIGISLSLIFLFLLRSELPLPNLGSMFIAVSVIYLIFLLVWEKTKRRNFRPIAIAGAIIAVVGIALIGLEYGTGAFSYLKVIGAQKFAVRENKLQVEWAVTTQLENETILKGVNSSCYQAQNNNGQAGVASDSLGNPIKLPIKLIDAEVRYFKDDDGKMITVVAPNGDYFVPVCLIIDGITRMDRLVAIPLAILPTIKKT